jgi:hypothetical protein
MTRGPALLLLSVSLSAGGCSRSGDLGSRFVKSQRIVALEGGTVAVSKDESPELAGTRLVIPPGALAADTTVTLDLSTRAVIPSGARTAGPTAEWGPSGTALSIPAELTLPYRLGIWQASGDLFFAVEHAGGSAELRPPLLSAEPATGLALAAISELGRVQPGAARLCGSDPECPGMRCLAGECDTASGAAPAPCTGDGTCAPGVCVQGACVPSSDGGASDAGPADAGAADGGLDDGGGGGKRCTITPDCPNGQTCINGHCR